jgi:hypothetical protein
MGQDPAEDRASGSDDRKAAADDQGRISATSMFAAVPADPPAAPPVATSPVPPPPAPRPVDPPSSPKMPVVHQVVFPSPGALPSDNASILSTLRSLAAEEKVPAAELPPSALAKRDLPEAKPEATASFVQSPASAGFTQLLRALSEKPPSEPPPSTPLPPVQASPALSSSSSASFTRLLRALDDERVAQSTPSEAAASVPAPTEPIVRPMPTPIVELTPKPAEREPLTMDVAPTMVFPVQPPPPSAPRPDTSAASASASFTQLFQTATPEAADQQTAVFKKPPVAPPPVAPKQSGSFTELFRAIDSSPNPPPSSTTPTPPASPPEGGFTQLFQTVDSRPASPSTSASPAPSAATQPLVSDEPGSFTQLFQAVGSGPVNASSPVAPSGANLAGTSPTAPPPHSAGSFTELFRAIDPSASSPPQEPVLPMPLSPMAAVPAPASEPQPGSSFTQIFRAVEGTVPAPATVRSPQSWDQVPQPQGGFSPSFNPVPLTPDPQPSDASNLTQLLRTLDPGSAPEPPNPPSPSRPDAFTSLYGERQPIAAPVERMQSTLATPNFNQPPRTEFAASPRNTPSEPAPPSGGASDFTRIIQASSLREQALRVGEQPIEAAKQATPPAPPPPPPQMPGYPPVAGQFPHPNVLPPLNFGHGSPVQPAQSFKPAAPNLAPPQWMPPEPPPPPVAPATKTPQLLPLVLIGIIFVLIVVLVAVIFLLKR